MKRPGWREMLKRKELDPDKKAELEKGDFLALLIAMASVFLPVLLAVFAFFALVIFLFLR